MSQSQKNAVIGTIIGTLAERDVEYEMGGEVIMNDILTDADKASIRECLFSMFKNGEVTYSDEFAWKVESDKELKKYLPGLVNNWVRKYKGFNNGKAYVPKNPGSRANASDEQLKALKQLLSQTTSDDDRVTITEAIETRTTEIAVEKAKSVVINAEALPEALRHLIK